MLMPNNLGCLAQFCDTDYDQTRYALNGVRLTINGDAFEAAATDTRTAVIVEGLAAARSDPDSDFNKLADESVDKEACAAGVTIPHDVWAEVFKWDSEHRSPDRAIAIQLQPTQAHLVSESSKRRLTLDVPPIEGKFPNIRDVIPTDEPKARICVDPRRLIECLQAAMQLQGEDNFAVNIEFRETGSAIVIRAKNSALNQTAMILLMPVSED